MKSINIGDRELQYKICVSQGEYSDSYYTKFYEGFSIINRKKYYLFGKIISVTKPNFIFQIWKDIESERFSKEDCKEMISKALLEYDSKINRLTEIKEGKIV